MLQFQLQHVLDTVRIIAHACLYINVLIVPTTTVDTETRT